MRAVEVCVVCVWLQLRCRSSKQDVCTVQFQHEQGKTRQADRRGEGGAEMEKVEWQ